MPYDDFGNKVDMVLHGTSVVSRLIGGQLYEQYINAASRDISKDIRTMMAENRPVDAWNHLVGYYKIVSPMEMGDIVNEVYNTDDLRLEHLEEVVTEGVRLSIPVDDPNIGPETYMKIKHYREPDRSCLTIFDYEGNPARTTRPVLVGELAITVLEKSATKPQAECVARLQNNGLPASATVSTRDTRPVKRVAGRCVGETEGRALSGMQDSAVFMAEIMELATCPEVSNSAVETIFNATDPMNISHLVDRREIPLGRSRSIGYFNHLFSCAGGVIAPQKRRPVK